MRYRVHTHDRSRQPRPPVCRTRSGSMDAHVSHLRLRSGRGCICNSLMAYKLPRLTPDVDASPCMPVAHACIMHACHIGMQSQGA